MEQMLLTLKQIQKDQKEILSMLSATSKDEFLSMEEACAYLKLSLSKMQKISAERVIPTYAPNQGKVYFLKEDLIKYIQSGRRSAMNETKINRSSTMA